MKLRRIVAALAAAIMLVVVPAAGAMAGDSDPLGGAGELIPRP